MSIHTLTVRRGKTCGAVLLFLCFGAAAANDKGGWTVGPPKIPPPLGASDKLRQSIAAAPQPDVRATSAVSLKFPSDWAKLTTPRDQAAADANRKLAEALSVRVAETEIGGVPVFQVTSSTANPALADKLFIHTHGGAFVFNRGWAGLREAILVAHQVGISVLSVDYRMPPEAPYPAAIDDVVAVWRGLLAKHSASSMAIGGTSAGGNLALASVLKMKELKLPLPTVVMASSPWADLDKSGDSNFTNEGIDRLLVTYDGVLAAAAKLYADGEDLQDPLISPVYEDFSAYPLTILFTGTRELFLSGTVRTHRKMRAAGVDAELNVFEGMSHAEWTVDPGLPETHAFTGAIAAFLRRHFK
jgi:monoterpene epsilon-lactone hydrolase